MLLFWSCLNLHWNLQVNYSLVFWRKCIQEVCYVVGIEFWKLHGRVSVYAAYYFFFSSFFRFISVNVDSNCFDLHMSKSFLGLKFKPFFMCIAVPPLLHPVAVNSKLHPVIITEFCSVSIWFHLLQKYQMLSHVQK